MRHRHRVAPAVAEEVDALRRSGRLHVGAAVVEKIDVDGEGLGVRLVNRAGVPEDLTPDWVVACNGVQYDVRRMTDPVLRSLLDQGLARAIARGDRMLLLITGKPPRPDSERPHARGAIRAAVGDWLAASRHADRIAAVRGAHPNHGGSGALYIVLRRHRPTASRKS